MRLLILALAATVAFGPAALPQNMNPASLAPNYGNLPLNFEANRGQTDSQVQFTASGKGYTLFLIKQTAVLALTKATNAPPIPAS